MHQAERGLQDRLSLLVKRGVHLLKSQQISFQSAGRGNQREEGKAGSSLERQSPSQLPERANCAAAVAPFSPAEQEILHVCLISPSLGTAPQPSI